MSRLEERVKELVTQDLIPGHTGASEFFAIKEAGGYTGPRTVVLVGQDYIGLRQIVKRFFEAADFVVEFIENEEDTRLSANHDFYIVYLEGYFEPKLKEKNPRHA